MGSAAAEARDKIRNTSNLCLRKLHEQCVADICECECHGRVPPPRVEPTAPKFERFERKGRPRPKLVDQRPAERAPTSAGEPKAPTAAPPLERPVAPDVAPEEPDPAVVVEPNRDSVPSSEEEEPMVEQVSDPEAAVEGAGGAWEDPPSRKRPIIPPAERALVDANPGRWRRVRTYAGGATANQGRVRLLKQEEVGLDLYEVKTARLDEGGSALYVRRLP